MAWDNKDYVEVADRVRAWYSEHPQGRIETELLEFTDVRVVVKARVYRDGEEWPAGVGHSYLSVPGSTSFTKGSELENAETSAVGRALVMAGIPAKSVASASEIKAKKGNEHKKDWGAKPASAEAQHVTAERAAVPAGGVSIPPAETPASPSAAHAGEGVRATADDREQGGGHVREGVSPPCSHQATFTTRLDGGPLPKGFVRCGDCQTISDKQEAFK